MKKKLIVLICIATGILVFLTGVLVALIINNKNGGKNNGVKATGDSVTRYEWIKDLSETFGLEPVEEDSPYFPDVDDSSEYYDQVQGAAHWGVISGDTFDGDLAVNGEYAAVTALKAIGEFKIKIYMEKDGFLSDKEYADLAVDSALIDNDQRDKALSKEECASILNKALELSASDFWKDDYAKIEWQDGVSVIEDDVLEFKDPEYNLLLKGDREYKKGDVIVFPDKMGAKNIRKVEKANADGSYELAEAAVEEACNSAVVSDVCDLTFDDFRQMAAAGNAMTGNRSVKAANKEKADVSLLSTKEFDKSHEGFRIEVAADAEEETLEITLKDNHTGEELTFELPLPENIDISNKVATGFEAAAEIKDIRIKGQLDYNGASVKYMDINTEVVGVFEGSAELLGEEIAIPLGKAMTVFTSGIFQVELKVYLVLEASGSIGFKFEVPAAYDITYEKGKGFRKTHDIHPTEPQIVLDAKGQAAIRPEVIPGLFLNGIIDLDLEVGVSAEGKMEARNVEDPCICWDVSIAAPIFSLGIGLDDSDDFMWLKDGAELFIDDFSYKWNIIDEDNAPIKFNAHFESGKSSNYEYIKVDECTYDPNKEDDVKDDIKDAVVDDGLYKDLKKILKENDYRFSNGFILELDKDYEGYATAAPWKDCGDYYEVEGYLYLANPFVKAGNIHDGDNGSSELSNTTINLCGHVLETGDAETLSRNKKVLDGLEVVKDEGKAIRVNKIDGKEGNWDVCFLYGPSETVINPYYYERYYDLPWPAEEVPTQYSYELCEAYYEDTEGNLSDITGAWFTHMLDIPTISEQKVTVRIRKDAVMAITLDADGPDDAYMATMQEFYENKTGFSAADLGFYEWYEPNEYGWGSMLRARIVFDESGMVKEVVPMVTND
ncbi:MAG: hypothetical protein K6F34_02345 [Lachnospiraceae bacterium]|nr:hypothetical protein [Lachnospiraceae bacterium]